MAHRIITINRMYGSGGRLLGKALAEKLGIGFYDKELIRLASEKNQIPYKELEKVDEKKASQWRLPVKEQMQMEPQYHFHPMNDVLFETQSQVIQELAQKEDCIIVGRCANYVLGDKCFSLFVYAPFEYRVQSIMERLGREEKSARALVKKMDKTRRSYYEFFTDEKWKDLSNYQMCIDTSRFDQEFLLKLLADVYAAL
ncbi:MAG TPA: cytidylate kinase-like family protein [Candidatus Blautia pullistercoris]|uniref:Cytidylate kinase-like family protein n=2 Tax=Blautia TaxID=572511 RepID=A0A9D2APG5_9FIRM|nr:cytidylate kinase-like family protein [Clostridiales bacterium]HIV39114.1 cytidylate kinase-like family protein [Candidatus Blautia stercorigallinarum]HIX38945.1 cytidylate kinase-like family protein [Candidatus Blautia pullistercoris]